MRKIIVKHDIDDKNKKTVYKSDEFINPSIIPTCISYGKPFNTEVYD